MTIKSEGTIVQPRYWLVKYGILALLLLLFSSTCYFAMHGHLHYWDDWLLGDLFRSNEFFLSVAITRAKDMLLAFSGLHSGLLVLQSGEFGINFVVDANIQVGNAVAQLTDIVSYGRDFSLFGLVALHIIETIIAIVQNMTPWLIVAAELGVLMIVTADIWLYRSHKWHMAFVRIGEAILLLFLLCVIIFPLSIHLVHRFSNSVSDDIHSKGYQAVVSTHNHILGESQGTSLQDDAGESVKQLKNAKVKIHHKTNYLSTHVVRYGAVMFLQVFFLPLIFSVFLFWLFRALVRRHQHWAA
ncbi:hypothetical protein CI610_00573 [invertebrate metagenome]|uniref:Uncharacterized protein n=1 Tax=invertebrate metagenome TaxID=1711999 RepID=A0A2H9TBD5_9ZZZZ